jgi:hypothetical protein
MNEIIFLTCPPLKQNIHPLGAGILLLKEESLAISYKSGLK